MKSSTCPTSTLIPSEFDIARERALEQLIAAYRMKAPGQEHFESVALALSTPGGKQTDIEVAS